MLTLWVTIQSLAALQVLADDTVAFLLRWKNLSGAFAIGFGTLLYANRLRVTREFAPMALFCGYTLVSALRGGATSQHLPSVAMYLLWAWCMFVLAPSLLRGRHELLKFLRWSIWATVAVLVSGTIAASLNDLTLYSSIYTSQGRGIRYGFAFRHPGYFGLQVGSVLLACSLLWPLSSSRFERPVIVLAGLLGITAIFLADSRTTQVMIGTAILVWVIMRVSRLGLGRRFWVMVLGACLVGAAFRPHLGELTLNSLTSGRLAVWTGEVTKLTGLEPITLLVGTGFVPMDATGIRIAADEVIESEFRIYRIDSTYVEVLVQHGLFGLCLLAIGLGSLLMRMLRTRRTLRRLGREGPARVLAVAIAVYAGLLVGSLAQSLVPSLGNLANAIVFIAVCGIQAWARSEVRAASALTSGA